MLTVLSGLAAHEDSQPIIVVYVGRVLVRPSVRRPVVSMWANRLALAVAECEMCFAVQPDATGFPRPLASS